MKTRQEELNEQLLVAVQSGNTMKVKLLVEHGADVNQNDQHGNSLISIACSKKNIQMADLLLASGASINGTNEFGISLLNDACSNGNVEMAELLINHGANINEKDEYGNGLLENAYVEGQVKIGELLISHGVKLNSESLDIFLINGKANIDKINNYCIEGMRDNFDNSSFKVVYDNFESFINSTPSLKYLALNASMDSIIAIAKDEADIDNQTKKNIYNFLNELDDPLFALLDKLVKPFLTEEEYIKLTVELLGEAEQSVLGEVTDTSEEG